MRVASNANIQALRDALELSAETLETVRGLVNGYQISQAIHVLVRLGLPDLLAGGPRSAVDLAAQVGAHEPSLYRLLRALAAIHVLHEEPDRRFALTELGQVLRTDVHGSLAGWAAFIGRPYYWNVWGRLYDGVASGEHAFKLEHGKGPWAYRQERPEEVAVFNRAMNSNTGPVASALLDAYDFSGAGLVVDVGGGGGLLLTEILKANLPARGILFDLPRTVEDARTFVSAAGLGDRCELVAGDFFKAVPPGADVYILKSILHDWYDEDAARILSSVRSAAESNAVLLVIESVIAGPNEGAAAKLGDLNMLVAAGGRERTRDEWEQLLAGSGWRLEEIRPCGRSSVLVARPA